MISIFDALVLSKTKLHTHRVRTIVTILLSSVLFALLVMSTILANGIKNSIADFNSQGLNDKHLVYVRPIRSVPNGYATSGDFIQYVKDHYQTYLEAKSLRASELGVDYDPKIEPSPVTISTIPGQGKVERPNFGISEVFYLMGQYVKDHPTANIDDLSKLAEKYDYKDISDYRSIGLGGMNLMPDGKEVFSPTDSQKKKLRFPSENSAVILVDKSISDPFLLPSQKINADNVPLIVSYKTLEKIVGYKELPSDATYKDKIARIKDLYKKAENLTVSVCYRNQASASQIQTAIQQAIDKEDSDDSYVEPDLVYGFPDTSSCGPVAVVKDTRTDNETEKQKALAKFNAEFDRNITENPIQHIVTFQIVGLSPGENNHYGLSMADILQGFTGSSLGSDVAIPTDLFADMSNNESKEIMTEIIDESNETRDSLFGNSWIVSFDNPDDARRFIEENNCNVTNEGNSCTNGSNKKFTMSSWANNSVALSDFNDKVSLAVRGITVVVVVLAVIILTVMIGRTVSDSRKETAVFRALGANRLDIAMIYIMYTLSIICIIIIVAFVTGLLGAYIVQGMYGDNATIVAKILFDSVNTNIVFNFFDVDYKTILSIIATIFITGMMSSLIPLMRNVPRNPIKDMREE